MSKSRKEKYINSEIYKIKKEIEDLIDELENKENFTDN